MTDAPRSRPAWLETLIAKWAVRLKDADHYDPEETDGDVEFHRGRRHEIKRCQREVVEACPPPGPRSRPTWIDALVQAVAELPDRTSPDEWPEAMYVTTDELTAILVEKVWRKANPALGDFRSLEACPPPSAGVTVVYVQGQEGKPVAAPCCLSGCQYDTRPVASPPPSAAPAWQPIATVPTDGTRMLTWYPKSLVVAIGRREADGRWYGPGGEEPTHWMPLPAPPSAGPSPAAKEP